MSRTHTTRKIALGLVVAAVAAPSAQAYYFDEPGTASNVPAGTVAEASGLATIDELQQARFRPSNEPVGPTVVTPVAPEGLPTVDELQQFRFTPQTIAAPIAEAPQAPSGGWIDWPDAGIGAAMAFAAMLLAAVSVFGLRRRGPAHS